MINILWDLYIRGLNLFFTENIMIVYNRLIKKEDIASVKDGEELIYYKDNNIAYTINQLYNQSYIIRKKKIFNNQLMEEKICKTPAQIIKNII